MMRYHCSPTLKLALGAILMVAGLLSSAFWIVGIREFLGWTRMFPNSDINWFGLVLMFIFVIMSLLIALFGGRLFLRARKERKSS